MPTIEIVDDNNIIEFRGRGLVSAEPDATNIVTVDNTQSLEQTGAPLELEVVDNALVIQIEEPNYSVRTLGIQGAKGATGIIAEDALLDNDREIDFIDDDNWYVGYAPAGTATSATGWKIVFNSIYNAEGDSTKAWADGSADYDKVWDDRLTYTY